MWPVLANIVLGVVVMMIEIPALIKKRAVRELWVFVSLLLFALSLSIAHSLGVPLPNPLDAIILLYKPFSDTIYSLLK